MYKYKSLIDKINQRLNTLNNENNKIILEVITDLENDNKNIYFILKVVNRANKVLYQEDNIDIPREYIDKAIAKYKCKVELEFYNIVNGKRVKNSYVSNT